jgi:hypothetical protein
MKKITKNQLCSLSLADIIEPVLRDIIFFYRFVDNPFPGLYTSKELCEHVFFVEYSGFLCRGWLPEYLWMNVPEAFFLKL